MRERSVGTAVGLALAVLLSWHHAPTAQAQPAESAELQPGAFLVASRDLRDPNFRETVVLILSHHRDSGALGLVINRPTEVELFRLIPHVDGVEELEDLVFRGGPVDPMQITLLVRSDTPPESADRIFENVFRSFESELLERLAVERRDGESVRAYSGYAGWAPGQLEAELEVGGWHVVPGSSEAIFDRPSESLWPELIRRGTADWASLRR